MRKLHVLMQFDLRVAQVDCTRWYTMRFGEAKPEWSSSRAAGARQRIRRCRSLR